MAAASADGCLHLGRPRRPFVLFPHRSRAVLYVLNFRDDLLLHAQVSPALEPERPPATQQSMALEITGIAIPSLICIFLFLWGASLFFAAAQSPQGAMEVFVVGKQWMWHLQHPEGPREINQLHIPVDIPVRLTMTSEDVITISLCRPSASRWTWFPAATPRKGLKRRNGTAISSSARNIAERCIRE